jgi:acetate kinase
VEHAQTPPDELAATLEHRSGLLALAGTPDMREVLTRAEQGARDAVTAREVYLHRLRTGIAAMTAAAGGIDALVFTGGVGENSAEVRWRAVAGLDFLGLRVDRKADGSGVDDREVTGAGARVRTLVVRAREDLQMAAETRALLDRPGGPG